MPSYEEVVLSLRDDGFHLDDTSLEVYALRGCVRDCDVCAGKLEGQCLTFRLVDGGAEKSVCLDRGECRANKKTAEAEARSKETEREEAVAAAVILPDAERFPEHGD